MWTARSTLPQGGPHHRHQRCEQNLRRHDRGSGHRRGDGGGTQLTLEGGSFAHADENAGAGKTVNDSGVTVSDGNGGENYDGTTTAAGTAVVVGNTQLFDDDTLSGGSFAFADAEVGENKTVHTSGVTVNDGNGGGNYAVSYVDNTGSQILAPHPIRPTLLKRQILPTCQPPWTPVRPVLWSRLRPANPRPSPENPRGRRFEKACLRISRCRGAA